MPIGVTARRIVRRMLAESRAKADERLLAVVDLFEYGNCPISP